MLDTILNRKPFFFINSNQIFTKYLPPSHKITFFRRSHFIFFQNARHTRFFSRTRTGLPVLNCPTLHIKLVVGLQWCLHNKNKPEVAWPEKRTFQSITEEIDIKHRLSRITSGQLVTASLTKGRSDIRCKSKQTLFMRDLQPTLNDYFSGEKLQLY